MYYHILPPKERLQATVGLPASKSISNRALLLHVLSGGQELPRNLSDCDDTRVMIRALTELPQTIDIGAAGTAMRFLTAYLSITPGRHILTGTSRMQQRPIRILVDALRQLGADITYTGNDGFPPLCIHGMPIGGGCLDLPGNVSSQYISALLMIGPILPRGLELHLTGEIISRPYIDLTLSLMNTFGAQAAWSGNDRIVVQPGRYRDTPFTVESDWSAASYWYEILALSAHARRDETRSTTATDSLWVELPGLFEHSHQGDSCGAELFARLGVQTSFTGQGVRLNCGGEVVRELQANLDDMPDLAQTFAVACCLLDIPFRFSGLQTLRIKETDRIAALIAELCKLGYVLRAGQDGQLSWDGTRCDAAPQPLIQTYEDHRMAMAFAPASLLIPGGIRINDPHVVSKSYPGYWDDLQRAGFTVSPEE